MFVTTTADCLVIIISRNSFLANGVAVSEKLSELPPQKVHALLTHEERLLPIPSCRLRQVAWRISPR